MTKVDTFLLEDQGGLILSSLLAGRLRERRLELGYSQAELAKGICEQGKISRIEKGKNVPDSDLLYQLSQKLEVSLDYFYQEKIDDGVSHLTKFKMIVEDYIAKQDYSAVNYVFELENVRDKIQNFSFSDQVYLKWIECLVLFYHYSKKEDAIFQLRKIIQKYKGKEHSLIYLKNTLFNFILEVAPSDTNQLSQIYQELKIAIEEQDLKVFDHLKSYLKVRYNYCRYLWLSNANEEGIHETLETIEVCHQYYSRYLLADLYCLLGNLSEDFYDKEKVKVYYQHALFLYQLDNNEKMSLELGQYIHEHF